jgi:hypothetical protein
MSCSQLGQHIEAVEVVRTASESASAVDRQTGSPGVHMTMAISRSGYGMEQVKVRSSSWQTDNDVGYIAEQMTMPVDKGGHTFHPVSDAIDSVAQTNHPFCR